MEAYFPRKDKGTAQEAEHWVKKRLEAILDAIIEGTEDLRHLDSVKNIDKRLYELQDEIDYQRLEVEGGVGFEKTCLFVSQEMHKDAKTMSVMEFETAVQILQERAKENEKRLKR